MIPLTSTARCPLFFLLCVLSAFSCTPKALPISVARIVIDAPPKYDDATGERESIRSKILEQLRADDSVTVLKRQRDATHRFSMRIYPIIEKDGGLIRPVSLSLVGRDPASHSYEVVGRGVPDDNFVASVQSGFVDGWKRLSRERNLNAHKDSALLDALADADVQIRLFAVRQLGKRKSRLAVPRLIEMLTGDDPDLVMAAVGSLVSIGDESAVKPLIKLTQRKDARFLLQVIFAVSSLGGRTAEAFLVTLASGHPNEHVQKGARDALAELEQKRKQVAGTKPPKTK